MRERKKKLSKSFRVGERKREMKRTDVFAETKMSCLDFQKHMDTHKSQIKPRHGRRVA